jgi:hypothetical protein
MFEIAGHNVTYDDIKGRTDDWYTDWTMTVAQAEQWKEWGMEYLQKNMKLNKKLADIEMRMFNVMYGLKYSDWYGDNQEDTNTSRAVPQGSVQPKRMQVQHRQREQEMYWHGYVQALSLIIETKQ